MNIDMYLIKYYIHPFVFGLYPAISILIFNRGKMSINESTNSLIIITVFIILIWIIFHRSLRNIHKSGFLASSFLALFFSFGHIFNSLLIVFGKFGAVGLFHWLLGGNHAAIILLLVLTIFFISIYVLVRKSKSDLCTFSLFLNAAAGFLLLIFIINSIFFITTTSCKCELNNFEQWNHAISKFSERLENAEVRHLPDIYYIILDGYARKDVLSDYYQVDNSSFYANLTEQGFYIAENSFANYNQTMLSLSSSLNFMYIDEFIDYPNQDSRDRTTLRHAIENNQLMNILSGEGYLIRVISPLDELYNFSNNVDFNLSPRFSLNAFENELLNSTPITLLLELPFLPNQYDIHRSRIKFSFDNLPNDLDTNHPVFTFVHILAPHPPFVFGRSGEYVQPNRFFSIGDGDHFNKFARQGEYVKGYRDQIVYITTLLEDSLERIQAKSPNPPIIIIQSDHGPGSMLDWRNVENTNVHERMSIINAFHFPDGDYRSLYSGISIVNTFRVVLDKFFGEDLGLLEDRSYFSSFYDPYVLFDVTEELVNP